MVVSGDTTVMEYLVSSREPDSVAPAQPDPIMTMACLDGAMAGNEMSTRREEFRRALALEFR